MAKNKYYNCKYCGARLRRDAVGQYCPTRNCQWHDGLDEESDTPTKIKKISDRDQIWCNACGGYHEPPDCGLA